MNTKREKYRIDHKNKVLESATTTKKEETKLRNQNHCFNDRHDSVFQSFEKRHLQIQSLPF